MDYMIEIERAKSVIEQAMSDAKTLADKLPDGLIKVEALTLVSQLVQAFIILNIRRPAVPCRLDFVSAEDSKTEAVIPDVHADSFSVTDRYSEKSGKSFVRFDPTAVQSSHFNPIQNIKDNADFVISMLAKMAQITLLPAQTALAKVIALREAENGKASLLSVIEAFEAEPTLKAFGAELREAALPGVYGKYFDPVAAHSTQGLYPMRGVDWAIASRTTQIDKDVSAKVGAKSLLDRLTPEQQKELDTWSRSQAPVMGAGNMLAWPGWAEALQQNLISKA